MKKKKRKTPGNAPKTSPRISQTQMHVLSLSQAGRSHEAIEFLRAKCDGANPDPLLLSLLGLLESRAGLPQVALERTREAAEKSPKNLEILLNYGEVLVAQGFIKNAISCFKNALKYSPRSRKAQYSLADSFIRAERFNDAELTLRDYTKKYPDDLDELILLAEARYKLKDYDEANMIFCQVIEKDPERALSYTKYYKMLISEGSLSVLESSLKTLIDGQPNIITDQISLIRANLVSLTSGPDAALKFLSDIHKTRPGSEQISKHRRTTMLGTGYFDQGWQALSGEPARLTKIAQLPHRVWLGEDCAEKTVLIRGSEGIGEQLMYSQLFDHVQQRCRHLIVECDFRLVKIFERTFPEIEFVSWLAPPTNRLLQNDIDIQTLPRDIAKFFLHDIGDIRGVTKNLVPHEKGRAIADRLRAQYPGKLLVGISWRSSGTGIAEKTIPLTSWTEILTQEKVQFVNLQYGSAESEIELIKEKSNVDIVTPPDLDVTNDLDELMGLISGLDLVITVSNVTAHYAGNVGTPAWVLISKLPMWHWFQQRNDSPWYLAAKLYRQKPPENWEPALREIARELSARCCNTGSDKAG